MEYKYASKSNYEDYSCGRVIYHRTGMPNFPVRLANEIFHRCLSYLDKKESITLYDPCCGGGYLLTVLGFLNRNTIHQIMGSDISLEAIEVAKSNTALLTTEGLISRRKQLEAIYEEFGKDSHKEAIEGANRLLEGVKNSDTNPSTRFFKADILFREGLINADFKADVVITDVPYGNLVTWVGGEMNVLDTLMDNLVSVLKPDGVIAICSDKTQKIKNERFKRLEKQNIGKRKFEIYQIK